VLLLWLIYKIQGRSKIYSRGAVNSDGVPNLHYAPYTPSSGKLFRTLKDPI